MTAGWVGGLISYHVIKHWEYSGEQGRSGLCSPGSHIPVKVREWWFETEKNDCNMMSVIKEQCDRCILIIGNLV